MKKKLYLVMICLIGILSPIIAQQAEISGTVKDRTESLIGVTVKVKGSTKATVTNLDGKYKISAAQHETLEFSYLGYKTQDVKVGNQTVINVVMSEGDTDLDEVVVIGYGTVRKSDLTGAISSVKGDELLKTPATGLGEMLRGKVPGVQVTLNSGRPGSSSDIKIRGTRSLNGGNTPLYVVDGIPTDAINDINPQDIASMEILKDAASQSIYGAKAANGVIFITTKRGLAGKPKVEYNSYVGFQNISKNFDFYDGEEWFELRREAIRTKNDEYPATAHDVLQDAMMEDAYENKRFFDWEDLMIKTAWLTKHDVGLRGGSESLKYALSLGYYFQDGMVETSNYNRGTFRLNLDWNLTKYLSLGSNISFIRGVQKQEDGSFNQFITTTPLGQPYNENGDLNMYVNSSAVPNPLYNLNHGGKTTTTDRLGIDMFAIIKPYKGLNYRINASLRKRDKDENEFRDSKHTAGKSRGTLSINTKENFVLENIINYDIDFDKIHKFNFMLVHSIDIDKSKNTGFIGDNFAFDDLTWEGIENSTSILPVSRNYTERKLVSFAGRIRYNLMDRYLLNLSVRRDGSSVFGSKNKWATFPSASFAWRINEESFLKPVDWISTTKLRLSYGLVGNQGITPYHSLGQADGYPVRFQDELVLGFLPSNEIKNPDLKWESTTSTNLGIDLGIFNQRVTLTFDYYWTKTTDLLVKREVPKVSGYSYMYDNLAESKTNGFDIILNGDIVRSKDFNLSAGINFSKSKSKLTKIDGRVDENGKPINNYDNNWIVGEPLVGEYYYEFDGIWQTGDDFTLMPLAKPGDIKLKDLDESGEITSNDRRFYKAEPDWYGTFTTNVEYKGFDLFVELYNVEGGYKTNKYMYDANSGGSLQGKQNGIKVNYWTPENPSNEAPRPSHDTNPLYHKTIGFQNASYFRLRTLTLGYTFPKSITSKMKLDRLRLYATGTNLYTSTDYKSYSPELNPGQYPEPKQFIFGLNLSF